MEIYSFRQIKVDDSFFERKSTRLRNVLTTENCRLRTWKGKTAMSAHIPNSMSYGSGRNMPLFQAVVGVEGCEVGD
jgi:hypothetical protein